VKQIVFALMMISGVAGAQSTPFDFTVPFPNASKLQGSLRLNVGYADADGAGQAAEVDLPIGSRVVVMATSNLAYQRFGTLEGAGQVEAMVDAVRFAGWHLAVDGGARRHYDGSGIALGRLSLSRTTATWSFAANADVTHAFAGPELETVTDVLVGGRAEHLVDRSPYVTQYFQSVGATARVASVVNLGAETLVSEGGRATTVFFGPAASFALPNSRARLDLSGGPIIQTGGNPFLLPDYTVIGRYDMPYPANPAGYILRLGVSLGF
jgi:hypothetical protein